MGSHKKTTRLCPTCGQLKTFDARHTSCSRECAVAAGKQKHVAVVATEDSANETRQESPNALDISLRGTPINTLEQLIAHCEIDSRIWECYQFVANKWEMGSKDINDKPQVTPLFQVKAWFRRKVMVAAVIDELAALKAEAKAAAKVLTFPKRKQQHATGAHMLELSIPDLHMGKLAWSKETGWEDYDSKIAERCYTEALETLLARTGTYWFDEVVLVIGNDLLNSDNKNHTTTRGTPQTSTDTRYQKTFVDARRMTSQAIRRCREIAPVRVVMVSGNHDELAVWHLGDSLECEFAKADGITIDNQPRMRKYHRYGEVGLMWTHGDKGKHTGYPLLFASERSDIWGATRFHEIHLGHLHQTRVQELNGCRVRILPSLCAADAWHSEMGYVGAIRSAEAFVWNRDTGLVGTSVYVVSESRKKAA